MTYDTREECQKHNRDQSSVGLLAEFRKRGNQCLVARLIKIFPSTHISYLLDGITGLYRCYVFLVFFLGEAFGKQQFWILCFQHQGSHRPPLTTPPPLSKKESMLSFTPYPTLISTPPYRDSNISALRSAAIQQQ